MLLGTSLKDRYQIEEELGRGGMAVVYRARDAVLQRDVAVKVLHSHLADRKTARQRLRREALAVAKLSHDNIMKVYDFSEENESGPAFLVTEYVRGTTLRELFDEHKEMPCEVAAMMGVVLCEALAHAHKTGIIHRDIKPENVMYRADDGALKLMDFGIAKLFEEKELTLTGGLLGSPAHMAPEVIEGKNADARSDLFSLGTMLYLCATGDYPFWANNPHALLRQISQGKFKDPENVRPAVGRKLSGIIKKSMALDPAGRYPDAETMAKELRAFLAELGVDEPYSALSAVLRDVEGESKRLQDKVVAALLVRAKDALKRGKKGEVLAHINRVFGYEPENLTAKEIVDSLHKGDRWLYVAGGIGGLAGLCAATWGIFWLLQPPPPMTQSTTLQMVPYNSWAISLPTEPNSTPTTQEPENTAETKPSQTQPFIPATIAVNPPKTNPTSKTPDTKPAIVEMMYPIKFSIYPYGDLFIDGELQGKNINAGGKEVSLSSRQKPYIVIFDHNNYATKRCELSVVAAPTGPRLQFCGKQYSVLPPINFESENRFKPAKVPVSISPPSATEMIVSAGGRNCGRIAAGLSRGVCEISMSVLEKSIDISILREGDTLIQSVTVTAGDKNAELVFQFGDSQ